MKKKLPYATIIVCTVIVVLYFAIYTVLTPFIRGRVIDAQTGKPVEDAWVIAIAGIDTRTIAGDVGSSYAISRHHLRTGKDGIFTIFPKMYFSIPTPFSFGNKSRELKITVRVKDGKRAETDLTKSWWKRILIVTVPVKDEVRDESEVSKELSTISGYCTTGMYFPIYRAGSELCDDWEMEYIILENNKFLKQTSKLVNTDQKVNYSSTLYRLALLYKRKNEIKKALDLFKAVKDFDSNLGLEWRLNEYKEHIEELERRLKEE